MSGRILSLIIMGLGSLVTAASLVLLAVLWWVCGWPNDEANAINCAFDNLILLMAAATGCLLVAVGRDLA